MSDSTEEPFIDETFFDPNQITDEQLDTIRKIARIIMTEHSCDYTKAVIFAYIEWLSMAEVEAKCH